MIENGKPLRVLHVVGGMDAGGVETWLMHVLRRSHPKIQRLEFLANTDKPCVYDQEIISLGSRVVSCPGPTRHPLAYARRFLRLLNEDGPYDVVHSHVHHFSGLVMLLAHKARIPVRIAHSHNDTAAVDREGGALRRLYLTAARGLIDRYATTGLACSAQAADALFGEGWKNDRKYRIFYCAIDLKRFENPDMSQAVRAELGLPSDAVVIGHVGRFEPQKNHNFLLQVFTEILRLEPRAHLLLVGGGPLQAQIETHARQLGVHGRLLLAGVRGDVPRLMQGAMDCLVFPSHHEGLPLVLIETQAAGLRCVVSDTVSPEVNRVPGLINYLSLSAPVSEWAAEALRLASLGRIKDAATDRRLQVFSIDDSVRQFEEVYRSAAASFRP